MLFICYPKCSTCLKAKKFLKDHNVDFEERDIKLDKPTKAELMEFYRLSGLPLKKMFNTSGGLYKENNIKDKLDTLSENELFDILASDGMYVKRPILVNNNRVVIGFNEEQYQEIIKG